MANFTVEQQELIDNAPSDYIRGIYKLICSDNNIGEHYCYLEHSILQYKLVRSLEKLSKCLIEIQKC